MPLLCCTPHLPLWVTPSGGTVFITIIITPLPHVQLPEFSRYRLRHTLGDTDDQFRSAVQYTRMRQSYAILRTVIYYLLLLAADKFWGNFEVTFEAHSIDGNAIRLTHFPYPESPNAYCAHGGDQCSNPSPPSSLHIPNF